MPTILLVDDEELSRFNLRTLLSRNFDDVSVVAEAETGEEAVQLYEQYRPDGVLMDIRIPGMNGLEASRRILEKHPMASILICSAYDSFSLVSEALEIGVKGYLLKPLKREEAVAKISRLFHVHPTLAEVFADQQVLALLTNGRLSETVRVQIERTFGELENGVLMAVQQADMPEESKRRLSYALKKRAPAMGRVFTGELESCFAAVATPASDTRAWARALREALAEAGLPDEGAQLCAVSAGGWPEGWNSLMRSAMVERVGEHGLTLLDNIDRLVRDEALATISLESLAADLCVTPQHLSATFKERVGINFIDYITRRRMRFAAKLLDSGGLTTAETASRCGYADTNYFRKLFTRTYGMTPHDYRTK